MKGRALFVASIVIMLSCTSMVSAERITVGETYDEVDILETTDNYDEYLITADSNKKIDYSFEVQGNGTIIVLFAKGHYFDLESEYYVVYSQDTPVKSFADTFPVGSDDGTSFTIVVATEPTENVTYHAYIKIYDTPFTDYLYGFLIFIFIVIVLSLIIVAGRRARKHRAEQVAKPHQMPKAPPKQPPKKVQPKKPPQVPKK